MLAAARSYILVLINQRKRDILYIQCLYCNISKCIQILSCPTWFLSVGLEVPQNLKRKKTFLPQRQMGRGRLQYIKVTDIILTWKSLFRRLSILPLPEKRIMYKAILLASSSKPPEQSPFIGHGALHECLHTTRCLSTWPCLLPLQLAVFQSCLKLHLKVGCWQTRVSIISSDIGEMQYCSELLPTMYSDRIPLPLISWRRKWSAKFCGQEGPWSGSLSSCVQSQLVILSTASVAKLQKILQCMLLTYGENSWRQITRWRPLATKSSSISPKKKKIPCRCCCMKTGSTIAAQSLILDRLGTCKTSHLCKL